MSKQAAAHQLAPLDSDDNETTAIRHRPVAKSRAESTAAPDSRVTSASRSKRSKATSIHGDSMLAKYFRDMASHPVMGHKEEIEAAKQVEAAEVKHWMNLLLPPM